MSPSPVTNEDAVHLAASLLYEQLADAGIYLWYMTSDVALLPENYIFLFSGYLNYYAERGMHLSEYL